MAATPANKGIKENRATPDSISTKRPILENESGALAVRIKEVVGEESVSSFSRRCGISEAVIRSYISNGRSPSIDKAVAIAEAGGVTVDWLATGRLPKTRAELRAALEGAQARPSSAPLINVDALEAVIEGTLKVAPNAGAAAQAAHCAKVYKQAIDDGLITAEGIGPGRLGAAA